MNVLDYLAIVSLVILSFSPIWIAIIIFGKHIRGIKDFCTLSPEEQLSYFGITDLGRSISLKSQITPKGENTSLVYDQDDHMIYFIHGRSFKANRSYESVYKSNVISYDLDRSIKSGLPIIIRTSMINKPIIRIYCITNNVAEEMIAALDLIMSNQPLEHFGHSMLEE